MSRPSRRWIITGATVSVLIIAVLVASSFLSEPIKNYAERQASERLPDFEITIGKLRVQPFRLAVAAHDVVVRLRTKPDPPLGQIDEVKAKVRFLPLLTGKIDLHLEIETPQLAATGQQIDSILHTSKKEEVKEEAVAWQDKLREMMPVRVSLSISDGKVRYQSEPTVQPIEVHALNVSTSNVTNRPAENDSYPSDLRVTARLADEAEVALESRADFLAKPSPRLMATSK
jgi:uncharacterized protein involved in outer membrane biogenesis